jgi:glycosyltransferase involved in cell wall biosynthesis
MVMQEAMASGLPCIISTNVGCILRDGVEGYVIPVGDVESLKDRIRRLYFDWELRRTMGVAARTRAEQFTWQEYGRRLCLMYRNVLFGERELARNILDMVEL